MTKFLFSDIYENFPTPIKALEPDIFIYSDWMREVIVFELTCPWDSNITRSHTYNSEKYALLIADLSHSFIVIVFNQSLCSWPDL